ncbi:MAG TPA: hypothetical protein VMS65_05730, partial [Polyangiaceae bacterium]|nr:hypothetical protein [Polyangiaceae bacterium]
GSPAGVPLTIVPSETHQIIDGFGVSINSASWDNGELVPALDLLLDGGSTIFRVVAEMTDWESTNDNADAQSINWCSFTPIYTNPRFDELWRTIEYLNQRGVEDRLVLSFMGRVPSWMGGADVSASMIDEWVETVASVAYYGRVTRGLRFGMFSPSNEIDWDGIEGPRMSAQTFATALRRLAQKLDTLGLSDLRLIGPETADINSGLGAYRQAMMAEPIVMQKLAAFALHNYVGSTGGARTILDASAYPFERFWISELSLIEHVFLSVGGDASAVLVWDGYDSVYQHAILANRGTVPPNDAGNGPALLAYSTATHGYTPRRIYYDFAQLAKWVAPGSVRIGAREDLTDLEAFAFRSAATGRVTIVGRNSGTARTLSLSGLGGFSSLDHFRTSSSEKLTELADVVLTNGSASVSVPSGSVFTLTGLPNGACP